MSMTAIYFTLIIVYSKDFLIYKKYGPKNKIKLYYLKHGNNIYKFIIIQKNLVY